jgi:type I restriction enzyme R subunit
MSKFFESAVEDAALRWLHNLRYTVKNSPDIAPGDLQSKRLAYAEVILEDRLRQGLARLNPEHPFEAIDDAFRKILWPEGPTHDPRYHAIYRWIMDGITVEYRCADAQLQAQRLKPYRPTWFQSCAQRRPNCADFSEFFKVSIPAE